MSYMSQKGRIRYREAFAEQYSKWQEVYLRSVMSESGVASRYSEHHPSPPVKFKHSYIPAAAPPLSTEPYEYFVSRNTYFLTNASRSLDRHYPHLLYGAVFEDMPREVARISPCSMLLLIALLLTTSPDVLHMVDIFLLTQILCPERDSLAIGASRPSCLCPLLFQSRFISSNYSTHERRPVFHVAVRSMVPSESSQAALLPQK
jgi:hypothetical protein